MSALTLLAFGLVAATQSVGALIILFAILLLTKGVTTLRWRRQSFLIVALVGAAIVLPVSLLLARNFGEVTATMGRNSSLTGRTDLWRLSLASIERSPILGYGYSAFWDADSPAANKIREVVNWDAPHAHNGFIDLTLGLGLAGFLLLMSSYLIAARRAIDYYRRHLDREAMWPLVFLSFFFLHQLTEGALVTGNSIYWILYVAVCCSVTDVTASSQSALAGHCKFKSSLKMQPWGSEHA